MWISKGYAHKVNVFAWTQGNRIFCEAYYVDGSKVKNGKIEVFAKDGRKLLEGKTDEQGIFSFIIPEKTDLKIVLYAGIGHRAEIEIPANELPEVKKVIKENIQKESKKELPFISTQEIRKIVEEVMDEKLHPLYKMLAEQKKSERIKFSEVAAGGIGYIFGILGIIAFLMRKKK
jgi:nickel transport protein